SKYNNFTFHIFIHLTFQILMSLNISSRNCFAPLHPGTHSVIDFFIPLTPSPVLLFSPRSTEGKRLFLCILQQSLFYKRKISLHVQQLSVNRFCYDEIDFRILLCNGIFQAPFIQTLCVNPCICKLFYYSRLLVVHFFLSIVFTLYLFNSKVDKLLYFFA